MVIGFRMVWKEWGRKGNGLEFSKGIIFIISNYGNESGNKRVSVLNFRKKEFDI